MRLKLAFVEKVLLCFIFLNVFEALMPLFFNPDRMFGLQIASTRNILAALTVIAIGVYFFSNILKQSAPNRSLTISTTIIVSLIVMNLAYMDLSLLWGTYYEALLFKVAILNGTILAIVLGNRVNGERWLLDTTWLAIILAILLSIATVLFLPQVGIHQASDTNAASAAGSWRGSFVHKSSFGEFAAISAFFLLFYYISVAKQWSVFGYVAFAICVISMLFAQSATAVLGFACGVAYLIGARTIGVKAMNLLIPVAIFLWVLYFGDLDFDNVLAMLGRNSTFTGRTEVWNYWLQMANMKSVFGYGLFASTAPNIIGASQTELFQAATNPHSGFIDVYFNGGIVGFTLFMALISYTYIVAVARGAQTIVGFLICTLLIAASDVNSLRLLEGTGMLLLIVCMSVGRQESDVIVENKAFKHDA